MADWKLSRRGAVCSGCERTFEEGETHFSLLAISQAELVRRDLCKACFGRRGEAPQEAQAEHPHQPDEELFWWKTRYLPDRKRGLAVDFEALEGLFHALGERTEERLRELRYLLCLLLMRKKRLKLVRVARGGDGEAMILRRPRREEELTVFVFDLDAQRMGLLRDELQRIFEGAGLEDVLAPPPEPALEDSPVDGAAGAAESAELPGSGPVENAPQAQAEETAKG